MADQQVPLAGPVRYQRLGQLWLYPVGVLPWEAPKAGTPLLADELAEITEQQTVQLRAELARASVQLQREQAAHTATKAKLEAMVAQSREALQSVIAGKPGLAQEILAKPPVEPETVPAPAEGLSS